MSVDCLIELEKALHSDEVRTSRERINKLLHDDFMEITQSGTMYTKEEALESLSDSSSIQIEAFDLKVRTLSEDLHQVLYETKTSNLETGLIRQALRSSIWKKEGKKWQMIFHQGTQKA